MISNKFNIGDKVYHATPESDCGIIIDAEYSLRYNRWAYIISTGFGENKYALEDEICSSKVFN
mgnify:FL=1